MNYHKFARPVRSVLRFTGDDFPGAMYNEAFWITGDISESGIYRHDSDEVYVFIGSDRNAPQELGARVSVHIARRKISFDKTTALFIPKGTPHGNLTVAGSTQPILCYRWHTDSPYYSEEPCEIPSTAQRSKCSVDSYDPPSGEIPPAPEGFLTLLLYLSGEVIPGAPYLELMWMNQINKTGPNPHTHSEMDEIIGFLGTDPNDPDDLGAEVVFYIDKKPIKIKKSCLIYLPSGVEHGPLLVNDMSRPIIHFSCGKGTYTRESDVENTNFYKP